MNPAPLIATDRRSRENHSEHRGPEHRPDRFADRCPVTVLVDPDDSPENLLELLAQHDVDRGVVVCQLQPGTVTSAAANSATRQLLGVELLVALGKSPVDAAEHRRDRGVWELAARWLTAERVTEIIVVDAQALPPLWADLAALAAAVRGRLWLVTRGITMANAHRLAVTATSGDPVPDVQPLRAGLAALTPAALTPAMSPAMSAEATLRPNEAFPVVPDVVFPLFRATARRVLSASAFAVVDGVYRETFAQAAGLAVDLRLSLLGHAQRQDLTDVVAQQLTIAATSAEEVLTRVRAAQAGLFAEGLFMDVRPQTSSVMRRSPVRLAPRLDAATVARIRSLVDPDVAAVVVLARSTALPPARLCRLRHIDLTTTSDGGLSVRHSSAFSYRVPAHAAGLLRVVLRHQLRHEACPANDLNDPGPRNVTAIADLCRGEAAMAGETTDDSDLGWVFAAADGRPLAERALARLRDAGAARAGITLPPSAFRGLPITDLCGLQGIGP